MSGKITLSLVLVAAGAALAAGGPGVFLTVAVFGWRNLHLLLFSLAVAMVFTAALPWRALVWPIALALLGLAVFMVRSHGWSVVGRYGGAFAMISLAVLLSSRDRRDQPKITLHRRRWAILGSQRGGIATEIPDVIRLVAMGGTFAVDLSTRNPRSDVIQLFLSCWFGDITVVVPQKWKVVAGRVTATHRVSLRGTLDSTQIYEDPDSDQTKIRLADMIRDGYVAVIHILGVGGTVDIQRANK
jgi:hypothetical protein